MARLELTTPRSQSECATNCATSRHHNPIIQYQYKIKEKVALITIFCNFFLLFWGEWWESNPRPPEPQSGALPTELHSPFQ